MVPVDLVVEGVGELAAQARDALRATLPVEGEQDLGVAAGAERVAKRGPQLPVVQDLAVEGDVQPAVDRRHRLRRAARVDDRQPAVGQADGAFGPRAGAVGTPVGQEAGELVELAGVDIAAVEAPDAYEAAHAADLPSVTPATSSSSSSSSDARRSQVSPCTASRRRCRRGRTAVEEGLPHERHELVGVPGDPHEAGVAVELGEGGRHDRQPQRQVLLELDGVAVTDPLVVEPRHDRHVEAGTEGRDVAGVARAQPVDVRQAGQCTDRTVGGSHQHQLGLPQLGGEALEQVEVDRVVVDGAEEPDPRSRDGSDLGRLLELGGRAEPLEVDPVVEEHRPDVEAGLGVEHGVADVHRGIGHLEQLPLERADPRLVGLGEGAVAVGSVGDERPVGQETGDLQRGRERHDHIRGVDAESSCGAGAPATRRTDC